MSERRNQKEGANANQYQIKRRESDVCNQC